MERYYKTSTIWRETLVAGKFGEFVAKLILSGENLANLLILRLKIIQQKFQHNFQAYH